MQCGQKRCAIISLEERLSSLETKFAKQVLKKDENTIYPRQMYAELLRCNKQFHLQNEVYRLYHERYTKLLDELKNELRTQQKKELVGEFMYTNSLPFFGDLTGKVVGMLLELGIEDDLLDTLKQVNTFHSKLREAMDVCRESLQTVDAVKSATIVLLENKVLVEKKVSTFEDLFSEEKHVQSEKRSSTPTVSQVLGGFPPNKVCEPDETVSVKPELPFCKGGALCAFGKTCFHGFQKHYCPNECSNDVNSRCDHCVENRGFSQNIFIRCKHTFYGKSCWRHTDPGNSCNFVGHGVDSAGSNDGSLTDRDKQTMLKYWELNKSK